MQDNNIDILQMLIDENSAYANLKKTVKEYKVIK